MAVAAQGRNKTWILARGNPTMRGEEVGPALPQVLDPAAARQPGEYDPGQTSGKRRVLAADPTNNLFWRFNMRRLTAEEIRDSILAVSGALNRQMFGLSIYPSLPREVLATASRPDAAWGHSSADEAADISDVMTRKC